MDSIANISIDRFLSDEETHRKCLDRHDLWEKVPLINSNAVHNFKDGSLVRFRGMIQDMHGPEYYVSQFHVTNEQTQDKIVKSGKYRDVMQCCNGESIDFDFNNYSPEERYGYVVVSVPGINSWVSEHETEKHKLKFGQDTTSSTSNKNKRSYEEAMEVECCSQDTTPVKKVTSDSSEIKTSSSSNISPEYLLNHPLSDSKAMVCHIKVYQDNDNLKLNDTFEFVGFLSMNSVEQDEDDLEMQTHNPPTSLVPRIHVICFKQLAHCNPLVDEASNMDAAEFVNIKRELLLVFTQLMLGDALAAEYLICHLISEIYLRHDYMALGQFTLNISNVPKIENIDYVNEVYRFLELLVPKSHYLPFTLDNMNTLEFVPKKDYESNRLSSGILQLSRNTLLVLDETKLQEGKLDAAGVRAVQSLARVIKSQKVTYDFNYYPIDYDCDIQFLIFSEGKSMLPSDSLLRLKPDDGCVKTFGEIIEAARHFLKPELLQKIRIYLTKARLIKYELSEQVQELVEQEFVAMRQNGNVTAQDLHSLLVLCRLVCLSEGKDTLDSMCWRKACEMESKRRERVSK
ncbi:hypothetical protein GWI33_013702 [Rhynchophorus ferrugineus]|uniref:Mini-chromosome maintenance complex-binding protein n=1 Tax=Rhynchophorus ferrugineus TaxID=354439 RepID=A0A834I441_RHYFE|nr:hypothetical protein GWI33_013702 [Rhynchophorus ferrugineus]